MFTGIKNFHLLNSKTITVLQIIFGVSLIAIGSNVIINIKPVPITLQTLFIMIIGLYYSPFASTLTTFSYVSLGVLGLPIFRGWNGGIDYSVGYSGGYLVGMLLMGYITPTIKAYCNTKIPQLYSNLIASFCGVTTIFIFGVTWLSTLIGFEKAFYSGFLVFIPTEICKILISSYAFKTNVKLFR